CAGIRPLPRARLLRLLPEPVQPDPDRHLRRWSSVALGAMAATRRRPEQGDDRVHPLLRNGTRPDHRNGRISRTPQPGVTSDQKILDQGTSNIEASVAKIAAELRMGFEK